jgi:lipid-A-disaccharide synthase-like uncharacterized protein
MAILQEYWLFALGLIAQACFGLRIFIQWWQSERAGKSVSTTWFWSLSLFGSILFLVYGVLRADVVIIIGQCISYVIYVKNLQLKRQAGIFLMNSVVFYGLPIFAIGLSIVFREKLNFRWTQFPVLNIFTIIGITGQLILNLRFVYQLYYAQRKNESVLPFGFWVLSLIGSLMIILYSIVEREPVLLIAQLLALIPYARNIWLSKKMRSI